MSSNGNGNGHAAVESLWPDAEEEIDKLSDMSSIKSCFLEALERQREIYGEVHRLSGEVTDSQGAILRELGLIRALLEGTAARVARLDSEGEISRDEIRAVRTEANGWRTAAEDSQQRAIVATKEVAEAAIKRAETSERLRIERESRHEIEQDVAITKSFLSSPQFKTGSKIVALGLTALLGWLSHRLGLG